MARKMPESSQTNSTQTNEMTNEEVGNYGRGAVVWADDQFKPDSNPRPWLILNNRKYPHPDSSIAVCLTTTDRKDALHFGHAQWVNGSTDISPETVVSPWAVTVLPNTTFVNYSATFYPSFVDRVQNTLRTYLTEETGASRSYPRGMIVEAVNQYTAGDDEDWWLVLSNSDHPFERQYTVAKLVDSSPGETIPVPETSVSDIFNHPTRIDPAQITSIEEHWITTSNGTVPTEIVDQVCSVTMDFLGSNKA